jgi:hypothetical protein
MSHDSLHLYVGSNEVTQRNTRLLKDMEQGATVLVRVCSFNWVVIYEKTVSSTSVKYILKCCS